MINMHEFMFWQSCMRRVMKKNIIYNLHVCLAYVAWLHW